MADAFENILGQPQVREFLRAAKSMREAVVGPTAPNGLPAADGVGPA